MMWADSHVERVNTDAGPSASSSRGQGRLALLLAALLFIVYNANGREIGSLDTQPLKYVARELAWRGTLSLDQVVAENGRLGRRPSFTRDSHGHWRSSYPILPGVIAGVALMALQATGLVESGAPRAPDLVAALAPSALTAAAVSLVFLSLVRLTSWRLALVVAVGLGLGTNYWPVISRTIWQHETVAVGLAMALWAGLRRPGDIRSWHAGIAGVGLAMAGAARPQVAPVIAMMLVWISTRSHGRAKWIPPLTVAAAAAWSMSLNYYWFGHVLGALPRLESLHSEIHGVASSWNTRPWVGAAGLLVSPSRGLFIFSPAAAVALVGMWRKTDPSWGLRWLLFAVLAQFVAYACYSVWWGGHTYGPRYLLDLLIPLAPFAALGAESMARWRVGRVAGLLLLAWSIAVAGLGAFVYPNERWNTAPRNVDRVHRRLWTISDSQIPRAFSTPPDPANFRLFSSRSFRRPPS